MLDVSSQPAHDGALIPIDIRIEIVVAITGCPVVKRPPKRLAISALRTDVSARHRLRWVVVDLISGHWVLLANVGRGNVVPENALVVAVTAKPFREWPQHEPIFRSDQPQIVGFLEAARSGNTAGIDHLDSQDSSRQPGVWNHGSRLVGGHIGLLGAVDPDRSPA